MTEEQNSTQSGQGKGASLVDVLRSPSDQAKANMAVILVLVLSVIGALWYYLGPDEEESSAGSEIFEQEEGQAAPPPPAPDQNENEGNEQNDSEPESSPSPTEDETEEEEEDEDEEENGDSSGFDPSDSEREPQDEDEDAGRQVLEAVLPTWAEIDTTEGVQIPAWSDPISEMDEVDGQFIGHSRTNFNQLFGGAVQMDVSLENATLVSDEHLWNIGSHSLWRVTIERDLVPNREGFWEGATEEETWDFLIVQDEDGYRLEAFVDDDDSNEDPETFDLPEED